MQRLSILSLFVGSMIMLAPANTARANLTLGFENISNNNIGDAAIGEAQLFVDVTDPGGNRVLFTFRNIGPEASSITDVYFDDGALLGIAQIFNEAGVSFAEGASPGHLPSGSNASPPFEATSGFLADSDPAVQPNGVNPGESLGILFDLQGGLGFADVLSDLGDGALRIGIRAQGFATEGSESFVSIVPVPGAALLGAIGLCSIGVIRRQWG